MGAETFLEDYKREVDRYVDEELGGGYASGSKRTLSLLKAGVVIFALTLLVPIVIAFFVRGGLFWDSSIVVVLVLSAVLAAGGVVAFSANKKSAERYSVEKRAKRLKQIAHDLVVSDAYKDLKRDEAARAARTKASSLDASQKVISLIWKFCYFLVVAIETFALAVGTDFFGFSLQMWYAFIPAAVFVVCQLVHCAKESRRCYFDLAAKIL
ncbi:MAG: hypothetical protein PUH18_06550 [Coriobacteriaceae bacterium]|nr:hypothetical protein [Coriobacteriaceae bacterium]